MVRMTGAKAIARTLKEHGVEYVFYIPGYGVPIREIRDEGINVVLTNNEKCAAYMADGYARVGLRPGVAYGYRGPGSMNLAAGLADAYWSSSPVIAITSATPKSYLHKDTYQGLPDMVQFSDVTKWNIDVPTSDIAGEVLRNAFQVATTGCPGPVHVNYHVNAIFQEADIEEPFGDASYHRIPARRQRSDPKDTKAVAKALTEAERPVIVAGQGVLISQAWDEVTQLAELLQIPIATSNTARGTIPDKHPLAIGVPGLYSKPTANKVIQDSDLVFYIGCRAGNMTTGNWTIPRPGAIKVVQLDIDPSVIGRNYKTVASMVCDAKLGIQDLIAVLKQIMAKPAKSSQTRLKEIVKMMKDWQEKADAELNSDAVPIKVLRLVKEIRSILSPNDIIVADTSSATILTSIWYEVLATGRNFINAAGSLGWGFPAAIGAKIAAGDRKVLSLMGDFGISYHIGAMVTAVRYNIPLVTVVMNNRSWQPGIADFDFGRIAEGFGAFGARVERPEAIAETLREAFESNKPAIVDVLVGDRGARVSRATRSWIPGAPTDLPFR